MPNQPIVNISSQFSIGVNLLAKRCEVFQHGLLDAFLLGKLIESLQTRLNGLSLLIDMFFTIRQFSLLNLFILEQIQQPLPLTFQRF